MIDFGSSGAEPDMVSVNHGYTMVLSFEEAKLWVKVDFFWREKKSLAPRGWASASNYLPLFIIPSNAFVDDKIVVFL